MLDNFIFDWSLPDIFGSFELFLFLCLHLCLHLCLCSSSDVCHRCCEEHLYLCTSVPAATFTFFKEKRLMPTEPLYSSSHSGLFVRALWDWFCIKMFSKIYSSDHRDRFIREDIQYLCRKGHKQTSIVKHQTVKLWAIRHTVLWILLTFPPFFYFSSPAMNTMEVYKE